MDPKEMGTLPTEVGSPTGSKLQNLHQTHVHIVSKRKRKFNFKRREKERGEYLQFKLWAPPTAAATQKSTRGPAGPFIFQRP